MHPWMSYACRPSSLSIIYIRCLPSLSHDILKKHLLPFTTSSAPKNPNPPCGTPLRSVRFGSKGRGDGGDAANVWIHVRRLLFAAASMVFRPQHVFRAEKPKRSIHRQMSIVSEGLRIWCILVRLFFFWGVILDIGIVLEVSTNRRMESIANLLGTTTINM